MTPEEFAALDRKLRDLEAKFLAAAPDPAPRPEHARTGRRLCRLRCAVNGCWNHRHLRANTASTCWRWRGWQAGTGTRHREGGLLAPSQPPAYAPIALLLAW